MQTEEHPERHHAKDERGKESPNGKTRPTEEERSDYPECRHGRYDVRAVGLPELGRRGAGDVFVGRGELAREVDREIRGQDYVRHEQDRRDVQTRA